MAIAVFSAFTRAVSWTTGVFDGLFNGLMGDEPATPREEAPALFVQLRRAIWGRRRGDVAGMLGAPQTACADASTWYYRFDEAEQQAIAIRFVSNRVRGVELIG